MKAVLDIGNSNVKCVWLSEDDQLMRMSVFTLEAFAEGITEIFPANTTAIAVGISGRNELADQVTAHYKGSSTALLPVSSTGPLPFQNDYGRGQAGIDRLANVAAAIASGNLPAVIVDAGTAITTEVVDQYGTFRGGAIMAGLQLQARALQQGTATLPEITAEANSHAIGTTTKAAIEAGLMQGTAGAIERLVRTSLSELGESQDASVIITGGDGPLLARLVDLPGAKEDATLTLRGLVLLARHQYPGSF